MHRLTDRLRAARALLGSFRLPLLALLCGVGWGLLPPSSWAAGAPPARSLRFEHIGLDEGLPQESVLTVLQDRTGFMWFGTQAGVVRFDGYRASVFRNDPGDAASLVDNYVSCAYEDPQGRLWFGTRGGLVRFDAARQAFVRYSLFTSSERVARNSAVTAIVGDGAGGLWIGTGDGLVHLDPASGRFRTLRHDAADGGSLHEDRVNALALDAAGTLWIGSAAGLDRLPANSDRFDHYDIDPAGAKRNAVWALAAGPGDVLWIGTGAGLEQWKTGQNVPQRRHVGAADGMGDARVLTLYRDPDGNLWVGTDLDGLKHQGPDGGRFAGYASQPLDRHTLSDNQVTAVRVDRTGTLWVGTMFGGVNRADLASGGFERYAPAPAPGHVPDPSSRKIRAIAAEPDGSLWLGTTGAGLLHLYPATGRGELVRHDPARRDGLPDDVITAVLPVRGRLWVGAATGLAWVDRASGRFTSVALGRDASTSYIQDLMQDRDGMLWVLTRGGLFRLDPDGRLLHAWVHDPEDPASLGENYGFSVLEDRGGAIWIGTENGLDRLDVASGRFTHFRHDPQDPHSLRHNRIYCLFESRRGDLWVGTAAGLHRMEQGKDGRPGFRYYAVAGSRQQVPIGAIREDGQGRLWVSTTIGITRVDPDTGAYKQYTARDGLIDGSYFVGSSAASPDGTLHFGGVNGMTSFQPGAVRDNPYPPPVVITDFSVPSRPQAREWRPVRTGEVELSWRDPVFTLEFAALHFADPASNRYSYRLRGFDDHWTESDSAKRFATYTNLDPGSYVFEVRAANKDGEWSAEPAQLAIRIAPPFWMTWWFRLAAGLMIVGAAWGAYRLRIRVLVQQTERLERQVGARTAELVLQKEGADAERHEAEAQREAAEAARRNIALLSDIGRELTANLDGEAIMASVHNQVCSLMEADVFAIGVVSAGGGLAWPFVVEHGVRAADQRRCPRRVLRLAERCLERSEEILTGDFERDAGRWADSEPDGQGALPAPHSLMIVPIMVGSRPLGVLTVQSGWADAYQHVQLDMLRTLASYVGVALDNADAYRQLKETQAQLAAHEKLASLGALVAGVAHELNTPIGNSLLMASTLQEKTDDLAARFAANNLKRSDLDAWVGAVREASSLIVRSLHAAADLMSSFKQVSVDQESSQRRGFDLAQACQEIAATMGNRVRRAGHQLELRTPSGIRMDSYPGPLGQVLINFINNALLHAFDAPGGTMLLSAMALPGERVRIEFRDDGCGIPADHLARIFDPFFTTRMGQGGTGLGLNIAWNIVTTLLGGTIRVESTVGQGTAFIVDLPLRAAETPAITSQH
jgi:ligand-binding sensor domain-containing protein/signal transduction histidine kinase